MTAVEFGARYAGSYDALYQDKDYAAECDALEQVFRLHAASVQTVLDLGCGTGNHAIELAKRGYKVTGVDRSEEMLKQARGKAAAAGVNAEFLHGDITSFDLGRTFDAALLMFAVLGYQTTNVAAMSTLRNTRRHLRFGGVLGFDVWYGPAVLAIGPGDREKTMRQNGKAIHRRARGTLDERQHLCTVRYLLRADGEASAVEEVHRMRYFFPMELELMLQESGFEMLFLTGFPNINSAADKSCWNVFVAARAIDAGRQ